MWKSLFNHKGQWNGQIRNLHLPVTQWAVIQVICLHERLMSIQGLQADKMDVDAGVV